MSAHGFTFTKCVPAVTAVLLAGCGGNNQPTVMFISPLQPSVINLGQAVQLAWSTTHVTACTATASSAIGGAFTGNQPLDGNTLVAPIGAGTVTYTLTCTGSGGSATATTPNITVNPSILSTLSTAKITTIGSTRDPIEKGANPYGLAIAPATTGIITAGDLIVCNFNDGATNTEGLGTTIVGLHATAGAMPYRIAQSPSLKGCNALTIMADHSIVATGYSANQVSSITPTGIVNTPFASDTFARPWGVVYVPARGSAPDALYVSNADGSLDRITAQSGFTRLATGFCGSGVPGAIFAPTGLTYDPAIDTLYIVDTSSNSIVALENVSTIGADGIVVNGQCNSVSAPPTPIPTFGGTSAASARVIASGGPLIAPISAALLSDGNLVVANADINIAGGQTPNLLTEVSPVFPGGFVGSPLQLDTGAAGALFGIVATKDSQGNEVIYFNDNNSNTVMMLAK
jgi:hypothetical protein